MSSDHLGSLLLNGPCVAKQRSQCLVDSYSQLGAHCEYRIASLPDLGDRWSGLRVSATALELGHRGTPREGHALDKAPLAQWGAEQSTGGTAVELAAGVNSQCRELSTHSHPHFRDANESHSQGSSLVARAASAVSTHDRAQRDGRSQCHQMARRRRRCQRCVSSALRTISRQPAR